MLTNPVYDDGVLPRSWGVPALGFLSFLVSVVAAAAPMRLTVANHLLGRCIIDLLAIAAFVILMRVLLTIRGPETSGFRESIFFMIASIPGIGMLAGAAAEGGGPPLTWETVVVAIACSCCSCMYLIYWQPTMRRPYSCENCGYDLSVYREQSNVICPECGTSH